MTPLARSPRGGERTNAWGRLARTVRLGIRENLAQFLFLIAVSVLVGGTVGQERAIVPLLAQRAVMTPEPHIAPVSSLRPRFLGCSGSMFGVAC